MNFLMLLIDSLAAFMRRNPLLCLCILLLALGAPSVLRGIAAFVLYFFLGLLLVALLGGLLFRWRLMRLQRRVEESFRDGAGPGAGSRTASPEGEVTVYKTRETPEKRIADDVGDYVDFEETKEP